jgi:molybdopterin/thiamine biosynthesis adenylyltransferase
MQANHVAHDGGAAREDGLRLLSDLTDEQRRMLRTARIMVCGLGNIGSWLVEFLACIVGAIVLVDRDRVDATRNRWNQFDVSEICDGRPKTEVIESRLHRRWPGVQVTSYYANLNDVPWSEFARADLICAGLDSLSGRRQIVNERAWPLGKSVVDGAVGWPLLGRVQIIRPGATAACLQCSWDANHIRLADLTDPCNPANSPDVPPTRSPAFLGATVAGVMAAEVVQILLHARDHESRQIDMNLSLPRWTMSRMQRASGCRFDHALITDRRMLPGGFAAATVDVLRESVRTGFGEDSTVTFSRPYSRDAFGPRTTATVRELANWSGGHLREFGCTPRDWLVLRNDEQRAFLLLEPPDVQTTVGVL